MLYCLSQPSIKNETGSCIKLKVLCNIHYVFSSHWRGLSLISGCLLRGALLMSIPLSFNVSITFTIKNAICSSPPCWLSIQFPVSHFFSETSHPVLLFPLQKFFCLYLSILHHPHRSVSESISSLFYSPTLTLTEMSTVCFFFTATEMEFVTWVWRANKCRVDEVTQKPSERRSVQLWSVWGALRACDSQWGAQGLRSDEGRLISVTDLI